MFRALSRSAVYATENGGGGRRVSALLKVETSGTDASWSVPEYSSSSMVAV